MGKARGGKQEVVEYRMSVHIAVAAELDAVLEVKVDDKTAWSGEVTSNTALNVNRPDLYGGEKKEGGLVGTIQVLMGRQDQTLPAAAASRYGLTPSTCPGFRGITTLMFIGSGAVSTGDPQRPFDVYPNDWTPGFGGEAA